LNTIKIIILTIDFSDISLIAFFELIWSDFFQVVNYTYLYLPATTSSLFTGFIDEPYIIINEDISLSKSFKTKFMDKSCISCLILGVAVFPVFIAQNSK